MSYTKAVKARTRKQAAAILEELVCNCMKSGKSREECLEIQKQNIGYFSGYYDLKTQKRVEKLYETVHPIFGSTENLESRKPENALRKGIEMGEQARRKKENL